MATCPKCYIEKPAFSERCPNCVQYVGVGEEIGFTVVRWIIQAVIILVLVASCLG